MVLLVAKAIDACRGALDAFSPSKTSYRAIDAAWSGSKRRAPPREHSLVLWGKCRRR